MLAAVVVSTPLDTDLWYLSRATGAVSLLLLTLVVLGGIIIRSGVAGPRLPGFVLLGLHRNVSLLALAFLVVHIASAIIDPYASIRLVDAVVPFGSAYRPFWLGLGALAFDMLLAIIITSLLRVRLGLRAWRMVHWLAYAVWPVALVHGLGTGTDNGQLWMLGLTGACVVTVVVAGAWRITLGRGFAPQASAAVPTSARSAVTFR
jgi:methionine sulfoxide reductase heme-binding subunit